MIAHELECFVDKRCELNDVALTNLYGTRGNSRGEVWVVTLVLIPSQSYFQ